MSYTFSFADNGTYTAADVNNITKRLVTSGVADSFQDGTPYNLAALNEMGTALYTGGVVPSDNTTLKVTEGDNGTLLILPGTAFFSDGSVIEIPEGGHTLAPVSGAKNYVYLKNDLVNTNTCYPAIGTEEPEGIYVPLAELSADGTITDKRTYARGKLPGYASSALYTMEIQDIIPITNGIVRSSKTYNIGTNTYRFLLAVQKGTTSSNGDCQNFCIGLYSLADGTYISVDYPGPGGTLSADHLDLFRDGDHQAYAKVTLSEQENEQYLTLNFTYLYTGIHYAAGFPITLYLF